MPDSRKSNFWQNLLGSLFGGAAAVMLILAALLPFYLIFKIDYAPTLVSNTIIEFTPPDNAIALQNALGALSFPFALLGGIMIVGLIGLIVGLIYALLRSINGLLATIGASLIMPALVWLFFPIHMNAAALAPLLATGLLIALITRRDPLLIARKATTGTPGTPINRRVILQRAVIFSFGGLLLSFIDGLPVYQAALDAARAGRKLFDFSAPAPRVTGFPAPDALPEVTDVADFYVMRKFPTVVPPAPPDWKLTIDGLVDQPLALSFEQVQAFPRADVYLTRECVSNPVAGSLISTALMSGARLTDVLKGAGVQANVIQLVFYGRDGYSESVPLADALDRGLLVYAMNGLFLPDAHGSPLKVEVPGLYGFKNMKWLTRIEAVSTPYKSVWTQEGWTETAIYKTTSRVDAIAPAANGAVLSGSAFAGTRGISKVEVQINGGAWQTATLNTPPLSAQTWVQWRLDTPLRGTLSVTVRAVDGTGAPQIETPQKQFPDGASGLHTLKANI